MVDFGQETKFEEMDFNGVIFCGVCRFCMLYRRFTEYLRICYLRCVTVSHMKVPNYVWCSMHDRIWKSLSLYDSRSVPPVLSVACGAIFIDIIVCRELGNSRIIYSREKGSKSVDCDLTKLKTTMSNYGNSYRANYVGIKYFAEFCESLWQMQHVQVVFT